MPEPLTIVTGVTALIVNIWRISKDVYNLIDGIENAPGHILAVSHDIKGMYMVLGSLQGLLSELDVDRLAPPIKGIFESLQHPLKHCIMAFRQLQHKLYKHTKPSREINRSKWSAFWWQFTEKDMVAWRGHFTSYKLTLDVALATANLANTSHTIHMTQSLETEIQAMRIQLEGIGQNGYKDDEMSIVGEAGSQVTDCMFALQRFLDQTDSILLESTPILPSHTLRGDPTRFQSHPPYSSSISPTRASTPTAGNEDVKRREKVRRDFSFHMGRVAETPDADLDSILETKSYTHPVPGIVTSSTLIHRKHRGRQSHQEKGEILSSVREDDNGDRIHNNPNVTMTVVKSNQSHIAVPGHASELLIPPAEVRADRRRRRRRASRLENRPIFNEINDNFPSNSPVKERVEAWAAGHQRDVQNEQDSEGRSSLKDLDLREHAQSLRSFVIGLQRAEGAENAEEVEPRLGDKTRWPHSRRESIDNAIRSAAAGRTSPSSETDQIKRKAETRKILHDPRPRVATRKPEAGEVPRNGSFSRYPLTPLDDFLLRQRDNGLAKKTSNIEEKELPERPKYKTIHRYIVSKPPPAQEEEYRHKLQHSEIPAYGVLDDDGEAWEGDGRAQSNVATPQKGEFMDDYIRAEARKLQEAGWEAMIRDQPLDLHFHFNGDGSDEAGVGDALRAYRREQPARVSGLNRPL